MVDSDGNVYGPRALLKPYLTGPRGGKYPTVTLGHSCKRTLHRLVAETFVPNPQGETNVAHGDGDRNNPCAWNLRWASQRENIADKKIHGTHRQGDGHHLVRVSDTDVGQIRELKASGVRVEVLAEMYGVTKWAIYDYCNPNRKKRIANGDRGVP